jgi:FkbM family methyltransferase
MLIKLFKKLHIYSLFALRSIFRPKKISLHGVKLNVEHEGIPSELRRFFYLGSYEGDEVNILKKVLKPSDIVMEVGAGIGFLSAYCADAVGSARVYAYEANPNLISKIKQTYCLNNVEPEISNVLLTNNNTGTTIFYIEPSFWSSSTHRRSESAKAIDVPNVDINQEINRVNPTFLIVDIEGGEAEFIEQINFRDNMIQSIIIELHPHVIGDEKCSKIVAFLIKSGFKIVFSLSKGPVMLFTKEDNN